MVVVETHIVTVGISFRTVFITRQGWYFITTGNDPFMLNTGNLDQITEEEFKKLVKNSKFAT